MDRERYAAHLPEVMPQVPTLTLEEAADYAARWPGHRLLRLKLERHLVDVGTNSSPRRARRSG
jgi:hypothetical protein